MRRCLARLFLCLIPLFAVTACGDDDGGGSGGSPGTSPPVATYGLSGSVSHLDTGAVTISDGIETLTVPQNASAFAFTQPLPGGTAYNVTVTTQPSGENCTVGNGAGTIAAAAVNNVTLVCNTMVSQPIALGVSAFGTSTSNSSRIFLPVTQVGNAAPFQTINAIVDTGSAGTTLNAINVFPPSVVSKAGFVFPAGQTSLTYNGITVTNVVATRTYGPQNPDPVMETGNLGFAQVTFGSGTQLTTAVVPIFFVYQETFEGSTGTPSNFANLIGINPALDPITVGGVTPSSPAPPCTPQSTATCRIASPFHYLTYAAGVDKGFTLNKVAFASCTIATPGSCPVTPSLTVGITSTTSAGFNTTGLSSCGPVMLTGTITDPICAQVIPSVMVTNGSASFTGPMIFDSGEPATRLSVPAGMTFPTTLSTTSSVQVTTASGLNYSYQPGGGYLATTVVQNATASDTSNSGIGFFAYASLLVDYSKSVEGWRNGS